MLVHLIRVPRRYNWIEYHTSTLIIKMGTIFYTNSLGMSFMRVPSFDCYIVIEYIYLSNYLRVGIIMM